MSEALGKLLKEGYSPKYDLSHGWGSLAREELISLLMWVEYKTGTLSLMRHDYELAVVKYEQSRPGAKGAKMSITHAPQPQKSPEQEQKENSDQLDFYLQVMSSFHPQG